jgi:predicted nucleotidyltransferase
METVLSKIQSNRAQLEVILKESGVRQAWLFGSILRQDFSANSDVDVLVCFKEGACKDYFTFLNLQHKLEDFIGRPVDLVEERLLENPIRRKEILAHRMEIYLS